MNSIPLKHLVRINERALPETTDPMYEFRYVDIGSIARGAVLEEPCVMIFGDAPSRARRLVRRGDTIISTVRTYLRAVWPVCGPTDGLVVSTGFAVLTPGDKIDSRYLGWLAQSDVVIEEIVRRSVGVSYPAIDSSEIGNIPVPLPDMSRQRAIANYLDVEATRIDALIAKKRRMADLLLERLYAATQLIITGRRNVGDEAGQQRTEPVFHEFTMEARNPMKPFVALNNVLSRLPAGWKVVPLCRVSRLVEELNSDGDAPMLSLTSAGTLVDRSADTQPPTDEYLLRYGLVHPGDLVVNPMWLAGGGIGVSLRYGAVSPEYRVYRFSTAIEPRYIHHLVRSIPYLNQYRLLARAETTFDRRITKESFRDLPLPLPPLHVQRRMADDLDELTDRTFKATEKLQSQISLLTERRHTLITYAVTHESIAPDSKVIPL